MPGDLSFAVQSVEALADAAAPALGVGIAIGNRSPEPVHAVLLRCQVQIEAPRRRYTADEKARMRDLFGEPERWGQTLRPMLWTNTSVNVPAFERSTTCQVSLPCTFDFNVAATKYFYGVEQGEIPITILFSGTIFYQADSGGLQACPIPWDREARFSLPARAWRDMMDACYPDSAWLVLGRGAFDALYRFRVAEGITSFDELVYRLLKTARPAQEAQ